MIMKTFQDLTFFSQGGIGTARQALLQFDNMLGVSVIEEPAPASSASHQLYELAVIRYSPTGEYKIIYPSYVNNDIMLHLNAEGVTHLMALVQESSYNSCE